MTDGSPQTQTQAQHFFGRGWTCFPYDPDVADWVAHAHSVALEILADPGMRSRWLRCGGTWFAGVNVFPNGPDGGLPDRGVPRLRGTVVDFIADHLGFAAIPWDPAQISVCFPGYPRPWEEESDAAFRFRRARDAAHVDGLRRSEPGRRRTVGEAHGFILGLPMTDVAPEAAPLVVYEGSHEVMRRVLRERLAGIAPEDWSDEDVTEAYVAARRLCFETCPRIPVHARPGEAYLVHRLALHGVAPWAEEAPGEMRMIAYFRPDPDPDKDPGWWLDQP